MSDNNLVHVGDMPETFTSSFLNEICKECLENCGLPCCDDSNKGGSECGLLEIANEEYNAWKQF